MIKKTLAILFMFSSIFGFQIAYATQTVNTAGMCTCTSSPCNVALNNNGSITCSVSGGTCQHGICAQAD